MVMTDMNNLRRLGTRLRSSLRSFLALMKMTLSHSISGLFLIALAFIIVWGLWDIFRILPGFMQNHITQIANYDMPSDAMYGLAFSMRSIQFSIQNLILPAQTFVIFHALTDTIEAEDKTLMTQPVSSRVLSIARFLAAVSPMIICRLGLLVLAIITYSINIASVNLDFSLLLIQTMGIPIFVYLIHDVFLFSLAYLLGKLLRNPILGAVAAYMMFFPSPLSNYLDTIPVEGAGLRHSEFLVLYVFYQPIFNARYARSVWNLMGVPISALRTVVNIWIIGGILFIVMLTEIQRRILLR